MTAVNASIITAIFQSFQNAGTMNESGVGKFSSNTGTHISPVISRVTGPKLTKFVHDVVASLLLLMHSSTW